MKMTALLLFIVFYWFAPAGWAQSLGETEPSCHSGQAGPYATVALLKKKQGVTLDDFAAYWRDVHGMLAARIPGFWTYRQYHLGGELQFLRRLPDGYSAEPESLDGFADVTFCGSNAITGLASSPVSDLIKQDERNVFDSSYLYGVVPGDSVTLLRQEPFDNSTGDELDSVIVMVLAKSSKEDRAHFRSDLDKNLAVFVEECSDLERLRLNFLQPYDESSWTAPDVNHRPVQKMDAVVEMQFNDRAAALRCLRSGASVLGMAESMAKNRMQQVYEVTARYAMVADGKPTQLALRGLPAMRLIWRLGASNQLDDTVMRLLYGEGR